MTDKYILNEDGVPVAADLESWAQWFESADNKRIVKQDNIGESKISTVFLALDHRYDDNGPPILWETMVFGGKLDQEQTRCSGTREQAEAMHALMVQRIQKEYP